MTREELNEEIQKEIEKEQEKEKELLEKTYGKSLKAIKEILVEDKQKVRASKKKDKDDILLVVDMLANVLESEDKDAIEYAFVSYKYLAIAHPILFFGRVKKITILLKDVVNAI